jgi:hypothetical protein
MKYKLLKDLPDLPAGAIFELTYKDWYQAKRQGRDGWVYAFNEEALKENPDWFAPISQ